MNLRQLKKLKKKEARLQNQLLNTEKKEIKEVSQLKKELNSLNNELEETREKIKILEQILKERKEKNPLRKFWHFLQEDTWQSWFVSLILIILIIKFIFFPTLSFITGTPLPLVVVESCSMYHESNFNDWWTKNSAWYESYDITKSDFKEFSFKSGLNKGDIIFVWGRSSYKKGDIIIFKPEEETITNHPIIHRVISASPYSTKGDHNPGQATFEKDIPPQNIVGKSVFKIPLIGWVKLIFFEPLRNSQDRGFCK